MYHKKQGNLRLTYLFFSIFRCYKIKTNDLLVLCGCSSSVSIWLQMIFLVFLLPFSLIGIRGRGTCRSYNKDRPLTVFPESDKCFQVTRILRSGWGSNKVPPSSCLRWKRLRSIPGFRCNLCVRNAYPVCTLLASYWGHDWESNKPCISHSPPHSF